MPTRFTRSLIQAVVSLIQGHSVPFPAHRASTPKVGAAYSDEDVAGFAADLDTALALRALARHGPDEACLLPRRMSALDLNPDEFARLEPAMFRELHWQCTLCESKGECAVDLAGDSPGWPNGTDEWRAYCPNASTLMALAESPALSPVSYRDCYVAAKHPDPAEQIKQRLEAFSISMRP
jgi:hypothetical protein